MHAQRSETVDLDRQHACHSTRCFIRDLRRVAALPLEMVRPDIRTRRRVHQLEIYSQRAVIALDVTGDRVLHAKICHEAGHVDLTIAI